MTDPEFKTELVRRLREHFGFFPNEESDDKVIEFAKRTLAYAVICLGIRCADLKEQIFRALEDIFTRKSSDRTELNRYRELCSTLLSQNDCLLRRNRGLRSQLTVIRRELSEERAKDTSKG